MEKEGKGNEYVLCTSSEPGTVHMLSDVHPHNDPTRTGLLVHCWWENGALRSWVSCANTNPHSQKKNQKDWNSVLLPCHGIFHCSKVVKTKWDNRCKSQLLKGEENIMRMMPGPGSLCSQRTCESPSRSASGPVSAWGAAWNGPEWRAWRAVSEVHLGLPWWRSG